MKLEHRTEDLEAIPHWHVLHISVAELSRRLARLVLGLDQADSLRAMRLVDSVGVLRSFLSFD